MTRSDDAARKGALYVPRPDLDVLVVTGPDRLEWLEAILTCDVAGLAGGGARWSLALTKPGKIVADVLVVETGSAAYLGVPAAARDRLHGFLAGFLVMEDADIGLAPDFAFATLHGPLAVEVAARAAASFGGFSAALALTGLGDAAVVFPRAAADSVQASVSSFDHVVAAREGDWERLRVERLVPLYGVDVTESTSPHEASLERRCISWDKGCYLGQEAVCMQEMRGKVKRRTALVRMDGSAAPAFGATVTDAAGTTVGETRTAVSSVVHQHPVALAVLLAAAAVPGTRVKVGGQDATVVEATL